MQATPQPWRCAELRPQCRSPAPLHSERERETKQEGTAALFSSDFNLGGPPGAPALSSHRPEGGQAAGGEDGSLDSHWGRRPERKPRDEPSSDVSVKPGGASLLPELK